MKSYTIRYDDGDEEGLTQAGAESSMVDCIADDYRNRRWGIVVDDATGEEIPVTIIISLEVPE